MNSKFNDIDECMANIVNGIECDYKDVEREILKEDIHEQSIVDNVISNERRILLNEVKKWDKSKMICKPIPIKKPFKMRVIEFLNKIKRTF